MCYGLGVLCGRASVRRAPAVPHAAAPTASARSAAQAAAADVLPAPAEFEQQSALLLGGNELIPFHPQVFRDLVAAAAESLPVICLVANDEQCRLGRGALHGVPLPPGRVRFLAVPLDTMWVRDYGPIFIRRRDGSAAVLDSDYSPVGDMENRPLDDGSPPVIAAALGLPTLPFLLRLEGGNFLSNGEGLGVTSSQVLDHNGDRGYDAAIVRAMLAYHLGVRDWVCLQPLQGEPTGHVDYFITFLAPDLVVVAQCDAAVDPANAGILDAAAKALAGRATSRGPLRVRRIPLPPRLDSAWRSYNNVLFANGTLLVPTFQDVDRQMQAAALDLYRQLLPGWKVAGIPADALAPSEGLLHCVAVNVPSFVRVGNVGRPLEDFPELIYADGPGGFDPRLFTGEANEPSAGARRRRVPEPAATAP